MCQDETPQRSVSEYYNEGYQERRQPHAEDMNGVEEGNQEGEEKWNLEFGAVGSLKPWPEHVEDSANLPSMSPGLDDTTQQEVIEPGQVMEPGSNTVVQSP